MIAEPIRLEPGKGYSFFRPVGEVYFSECANLVSKAIQLACSQGVDKLLIDISGLTGFDAPTTAPRYFLAELLATEANQPIKFALVCRPELIRENHYGTMIGRNRGLFCEVFPSEPEAIKWLMAP